MASMVWVTWKHCESHFPHLHSGLKHFYPLEEEEFPIIYPMEEEEFPIGFENSGGQVIGV